jgi:glycine betaine catabolism B
MRRLLPQLAELTAETLWYCLEVIDRAPRVRSFRFEVPPYHGVGQPQPGQRLIVRATIGGVEVQRPYTLTSSVTERRYYEITVQREPHGIMSNWLFDNMGLGSAVSILPPCGTCFFELHETRPLVCLVGGIGITPVLGICRSAAASRARRRVHVDYSVSTRSEMVCAEELSELASQHQTITCHTRITREQGRFRGPILRGSRPSFLTATGSSVVQSCSRQTRNDCFASMGSRLGMCTSNLFMPSATRYLPSPQLRP